MSEQKAWGDPSTPRMNAALQQHFNASDWQLAKELFEAGQGLERELAAAQSAGDKYIALTDPLLSCHPENFTCGQCRACYIQRSHAAEKELEINRSANASLRVSLKCCQDNYEQLEDQAEAAERDLRLRDACSPPLTRDETIRELEESVRKAVLRADALEKERDEARARNDNLRDLFDRALADVFDGMGCLPECDTFGHEPECPAVHGHMAFRQLRARAESATRETEALREALAEMMREVTLPWACPDHPQAQIRRSWDQTQYVMNGYPAGVPLKSNYKYECAECGRELAPDTKEEPQC